MRRFKRLLTSISLAAIGGLLIQDAAAADSLSMEQEFVQLINAERSAAGLSPLHQDAAAIQSARNHSARMASELRLYHNPALPADFSDGAWAALGENVGMGPATAAEIHAMFMASPGHRANVLGDYDHVGVGVVQAAGGIVFVTEVFVKRQLSQPSGSVAPAKTVTKKVCRKVRGKTKCTIVKKKVKKARKTRRR